MRVEEYIDIYVDGVTITLDLSAGPYHHVEGEQTPMTEVVETVEAVVEAIEAMDEGRPSPEIDFDEQLADLEAEVDE